MTVAAISVVQADITDLCVDAIVTAANEALVGGHGVDGAVHRAAGPGLFAECQTLRYCPEGEARITGAYNLPAKFVIHTVGPVWEGGEYGEQQVLRSCYLSVLRLAMDYGVESVAFPCIATGAHEFPAELACKTAVQAVFEWRKEHDLPSRVIFCCFEDEDYEAYRRELAVARPS